MAWVKGLAEDFRGAVEDTNLWKVFWDDGFTKQREEKIVHAVAGAMWVQQCKAADVDVSKEPNMGRAPVDFKFSAGWTKRALIEVKFIGSTKVLSGCGEAAAAVPQDREDRRGLLRVHRIHGRRFQPGPTRPRA
jgi:hypothetical protein